MEEQMAPMWELYSDLKLVVMILSGRMNIEDELRMEWEMEKGKKPPSHEFLDC